MRLCYSAFAARAIAAFAIAAFAVATLAAAPALAHTTGVSQSDFTVGPDGAVDAQLVFAAAEIAGAVALDANHDGTVTEAELADARSDLKRIVMDGVEVKADGAACPGAFVKAELTELDGLVLAARYACPAGARAIEVTLYVLSELRPEHRHVARISGGGVVAQKMMSGTNRSAMLEVPPSGTARPKPAAWKRTTLVIVSAVWAVGTIAFVIWRRRRLKR